jgi:hypothetical protein
MSISKLICLTSHCLIWLLLSTGNRYSTMLVLLNRIYNTDVSRKLHIKKVSGCELSKMQAKNYSCRTEVVSTSSSLTSKVQICYVYLLSSLFKYTRQSYLFVTITD